MIEKNIQALREYALSNEPNFGDADFTETLLKLINDSDKKDLEVYKRTGLTK